MRTQRRPPSTAPVSREGGEASVHAAGPPALPPLGDAASGRRADRPVWPRQGPSRSVHSRLEILKDDRSPSTAAMPVDPEPDPRPLADRVTHDLVCLSFRVCKVRCIRVPSPGSVTN